ncbi:MAG: sugar phosphate isomerase/epimerase [Rhodothermales bacterium]
MTNRRDFLTRLGSVLAVPAALSVAGCGEQAGDVESSAAGAGDATAFDGPVGVQLYSVRNELDADLEGTLRAVKSAGFDIVETYSLHDMTAAEYRGLLDDVGLDVQSMHMSYERAVGETEAVAEEARTLGSPWVVVPWIPHEEPFSSDDMNRAIADFTAAGEAYQSEGLRFAYHAHGYEFHEAEEGGTLFDRFMEETEPGVVDVQLDVFWVRWPGQDPIALMERYPGRFPSLHIKDMRQGTTGGDLTGHAPLELQVPIGEGLMDWPSILRKAEEVGAELYFIEYEHTNPIEVIGNSLEYLRSLQA